MLTLSPEWDPSTNPGSLTATVLDEWGRIHESSAGGVSSKFVSIVGNQGIPEVAAAQLLVDDADLSRTQTFFTDDLASLEVDSEDFERKTRYDQWRRVSEVEEPLGGLVRSEYDVVGQVTRTTLWSAGANELLKDSRFTHDEMGRIIQLDHVLLRSSGAYSDPADLVDGALTPGDERITTRTQYGPEGYTVAVVSDDGGVLLTTRDILGRKLSQTDPAGNITSWQYDAAGNAYYKERISLSTSGAATYTERAWSIYSNTGRLLANVQQSGDNASRGDVTRFYYDAFGQLVLSTDGLGGSASLVPITSLDTDGLGYHAGIAVDVNNHGNQTVTHFDERGFSVQTDLYMRVGGRGSGALLSGTAGVISTARTYSANGWVLSQSDDKGNTTSYVYDNQGRVKETHHPDGSLASVTYDLRGLVKTATDPNGTVKTQSYDGNGNLLQTSIALAPGVEGANLYLFRYDDGNRLKDAYSYDPFSGPGQWTHVERTYNTLGGVTSETAKILGVGGTTTVTSAVYDEQGFLLEQTYPEDGLGNPSTVLEYDRVDQLKRLQSIEVQGTPATTVADFEYLGALRGESVTYGNGVINARSYDLQGRIDEAVSISPTAGLVLQISNVWDAEDNRIQREDRASSQTRTRNLSYDSIGRLATSQRLDPMGGVLESVTYQLDGVGNREQVLGGLGAGLYTQDPLDTELFNSYTSTPEGTLSHDANGNVTQVSNGTNTRAFTYNASNQLIKVVETAPALEVRFLYDAFGRRVMKSVVSSDTYSVHYRYLVTGALAQERYTNTTQTTEWVREHTYAGSQGVPIRTVMRGSQSGEQYFLTDDLQNILAITDSTGAVVEQWDYTDFGLPVDPATWVELTNTASGNAFGFNGKYIDWELTLYHFPARSYDPKRGRFLVRDPLGSWGDSMHLGNGYTYAANSPWSKVDDTGLMSLQPVQSPTTMPLPAIRPGMSGIDLAMAAIGNTPGLMMTGNFEPRISLGARPQEPGRLYNSNGDKSSGPLGGRKPTKLDFLYLLQTLSNAEVALQNFADYYSQDASGGHEFWVAEGVLQGLRAEVNALLSEPSSYSELQSLANDLRDMEFVLEQMLAQQMASVAEGNKGWSGHDLLDLAGMVPVLGTAADLLNAALYALEGDALNATISLTGVLPGGQVATGTRLGVKSATNALDALIKVKGLAGKQGIYSFMVGSRRYIGQSQDLARRFKEHWGAKKLMPDKVSTISWREVTGGKTLREVAERKQIDQIGGLTNTANRRLPVSDKRMQRLIDEGIIQ